MVKGVKMRNDKQCCYGSRFTQKQNAVKNDWGNCQLIYKY